jgi:hypothetical protein
MYDKDKQNQYNTKWQKLNPEKWAEINRKGQANFYQKNKDKQKEKSMKHYYLKKEMEIFRNILL